VHQLVQGEARPKAKAVRADAAHAPAITATPACALCGAARIEAGGEAPLCAACREAGRVLMAGKALEDDRGLRLVRRHQRPHCLGCGRVPEAGEGFLAGPEGAVCAACLGRR